MKLLLIFILNISIVFTQHQMAIDDETICNEKFRFSISDTLYKNPINKIIIEIGKSFIGTPYIANSLEAGDEEKLVVNLRALDCVSFYENTLAIARCVKKQKYTFENYKKELEQIRYRNGKIEGYWSRLHYTSDYFFNNQEKGILKIVTPQIAPNDILLKIPTPLDFMTTHRDQYIHLKENKNFVNMLVIEDMISRRRIAYLPKIELKEYESKIESGDILGITTNIKGLDVTHTGIAYRDEKGILKLLHAPNVGQKVKISEQSLSEYLKSNSKFTGLIIARAENL
ncbi:MAG: DUF1460 domain-containing protein [Bacteroidetes bacterium]|nr:DUF1460 domain-containing protein [Bacteroidota bacterium]